MSEETLISRARRLKAEFDAQTAAIRKAEAEKIWREVIVPNIEERARKGYSFVPVGCDWNLTSFITDIAYSNGFKTALSCGRLMVTW